MPNHDLTKRPAIAKIKHAQGNTVMYSDPSMKPDPDARGIRLAVGATKKTWILSKRLDGKVRSITLGAWPDLPTVYAARDVAKEKMNEATTRTDARSTGIKTPRDALLFHIERSKASERTLSGYITQVDHNMRDLFDRSIEKLTLPDLERALVGHNVGTQKHLAQIIRTSFKRAAAVRRIYNVADDLKVDTKGHQPDNSVRFNTQDRWPALDLIEARKEKNLIIATAFEIMLFTGLRAGNAINLRWSDIDLENARLAVDRMKNGRRGV